MKNSRQTKLLVIIALILAITGMTLGFAAFSSTLSISSSASVTPNSNDFKIKIYGYTEQNVNNMYNINAYTSESLGYGIDANTGNALNAAALINNTNLTITGIDVQMTQPSDFYAFPFLIKNVGQYDAYFNLSQIIDSTPLSCNAESGTTESLVNSACESIIQLLGIMTETGMEIELKFQNNQITEDEYLILSEEHQYTSGATGTIKLEPDKSLLLLIGIDYPSDANRADGPFSVTFEDIKLEFTTTPPNQE